MKRQLKKTERTALYVGGVLFALILLWLVWINPMRTDIKSLTRRVSEKREKRREAVELKETYVRLRGDMNAYAEIITRREIGFSLSGYITKVEGDLNFPNQERRPETTRRIGTEFVKTSIGYKYVNKSLDEIIAFLYVMENPDNAIVIDSFNLIPNRRLRGEKFDIQSIEFSAVTRVAE
jgi:hypothetical protein